MEHVKNGEKLDLPVYSYFSKTDSVIIVNDYRPVVKSIYDVKKPIGYLVPKQQKQVVDWIARQGLITGTPVLNGKERIEEYSVVSIDSIDFEGDIIVNPVIVAKNPDHEISAADYIYIPTAQLKGNMIVYALEPKSMLGLATYQQFAYLLKAGENYPVLRVIKK